MDKNEKIELMVNTFKYQLRNLESNIFEFVNSTDVLKISDEMELIEITEDMDKLRNSIFYNLRYKYKSNMVK